MLFIYQSKLYNNYCVLARNIRIKTKAPVKLTGAPLLGLAKSIYYYYYVTNHEELQQFLTKLMECGQTSLVSQLKHRGPLLLLPPGKTEELAIAEKKQYSVQ